MDGDTLRERLRERLAATGKKPVPLAVSLGRGRDYLTDILNGKKDSLASDTLTPLATALACDERYFTDLAFVSPGRPRRQATVNDLDRHARAGKEGLLLKAWREFRGLELTDVVDETGWSLATVVDLDEGNRAPTTEELTQLASALSTTPGSLSNNPFETDQRVAALASITEGLGAEDQRALIKMAEGMARKRTGTEG